MKAFIKRYWIKVRFLLLTMFNLWVPFNIGFNFLNEFTWYYYPLLITLIVWGLIGTIRCFILFLKDNNNLGIEIH